MDRDATRRETLVRFGAGSAEQDELLAYDASPFDRSLLPAQISYPLAPEPYVAAWEGYAAEAGTSGAFETLRRRFPQLNFPIRTGISQSDDYRAATLRGGPVESFASASGLQLERPDELQIKIHRSLAGPVPVLIPAGRADFVTLVQALSMRNEPLHVPDSQGAATVKGFNNWGRIRAYRAHWQAEGPDRDSDAAWAAEFQRLIPQPELYRDHFIILSDGHYSAVRAADLGLDEDSWRRLSLEIRAEHECTHTLTFRLYGITRNNALDEFLCDYMGIVSAIGRFRSDWLDRFMGLESFPSYREGGRLQNYLGTPPLSDRAFSVLQALVHAAADNLQRFDDATFAAGDGTLARGPDLPLLFRLTLEELATEDLTAVTAAG